MKKLSHLDAKGAARMVDVSEKAVSAREATAEAVVVLSAEAYAAAKEGDGPKGDVIGTARVAGIMAAKRTSELIPLCHTLALTKIDMDFQWQDERKVVRITSIVKTSAQTGVEMEALTAVSVAALTVYDMTKAIDKGTIIESVKLIAKSGGKSGEYTAPAQRIAKPKAIMNEVAAPKPGPHAQRDAFREFMATNRLRPTQWAKDANVPAAQILAYLTGQTRALSPETAKKLARAAKVKVEDMFR
jgi:cyclic pyranopterin phosphate synthase